MRVGNGTYRRWGEWRFALTTRGYASKLRFALPIPLRFVFIPFILLTVWGQHVSAQSTECERILAQARNNYQAGLLDDINTQALRTCVLEANLSKSAQVEAFRLLINLSLFLGNKEAAVQYMKLLLILDPGIQPISTDSREFEYLLAEFDRAPTRFLMGKASLHWTRPIRTQRYASSSILRWDSTRVNAFPSYGFTALVEKPLVRSLLTVGVGVSFQQRDFLLTDFLRTDQDSNFARLTLHEHQNWLEVPLVFRARIKEWQLPRFIPFTLGIYGYAGVGGQLLIGARLQEITRSIDPYNPNQVNVSPQDSSGVQVIATDVPLTQTGSELRNVANINWLIGVGCQLQPRQSRGYFLLDIEMNGTLRNLTRRSNRYLNRQLTYTFGYISDDFWQLTAPVFSVGYRRIFYDPAYSPKKRTKKRP